MPAPAAQWQILPSPTLSDDWIEAVRVIANLPSGNVPQFGAQLLWQRGLRTVEQLQGFLQPDLYQPASPFSFGKEMNWAVERLLQARHQQETVAIWGDFDADGITSTAVLWDGLGEFFTPHEQLVYFIPNRLKESHGLSQSGLELLAKKGVQLIVTCDTGSTSLEAMAYAQELGMAIIVTDHHTLPAERPPVVAIINPRYLPQAHPLAHLSGVAVAFKLVEALYETLPEVPQRPLQAFLDLVAIGLIADLVDLKGDCRYLAQKGIEQLQTHLKNQQDPLATVSRPGIARLLELCRRTGDRPTDISFGLGPRINAVSRIHGDARFCVELLTSQDQARCRELAEQTELANARRKALQNDVLYQVKQRLADLDLSTTGLIILADPQWPAGVLGIVAGQLAQEYGRPTILFTLDEAAGVARGSARSVRQIDLYDLVAGQAHLLEGFGGHPLAAGMSLAIENLPVFTAAINRELRQRQGAMGAQGPIIQADLTVTVSALGKDLFQELCLLEPCGMGNPVPKLLIKNCWFENTWHQKIKDPGSDRKLQYIKASFLLKDDSTIDGFPGMWWGHYKDDLLPGRWDVIVELDFNSFSKKRQPRYGGYEVRLMDMRPAQAEPSSLQPAQGPFVIDQRSLALATGSLDRDNWCQASPLEKQHSPYADLVLTACPSTWETLRPWFHQANQQQKPLVLAYGLPFHTHPIETWKTLVGMAKYLSRTGERITLEPLIHRLQISEACLERGIAALRSQGFSTQITETGLMFRFEPSTAATPQDRTTALRQFLAALQEEQFRQQYFCQVPIETAQSVMRGEVGKF